MTKTRQKNNFYGHPKRLRARHAKTSRRCPAGSKQQYRGTTDNGFSGHLTHPLRKTNTCANFKLKGSTDLPSLVEPRKFEGSTPLDKTSQCCGCGGGGQPGFGERESGGGREERGGLNKYGANGRGAMFIAIRAGKHMFDILQVLGNVWHQSSDKLRPSLSPMTPFRYETST